MNITKKELLLFTFFSGISLLYSYYYYLKGKSSSEINKLWGGITGNVRSVYKLSMLLCIVCMFSIIYKLFKSDKKDFKDEFYGLSMLIVTSIFYLPLTIKYIKNPSTITFINLLGTLFYVALGAIILYRLNPGYDTGYLMFHLVVLDLFYWSYRFFTKY